MDTFDVLLSRLRADPFDSSWFDAWNQADGERAEQLVELARSSLPLEQIASGPADDLGLGPDWRAHCIPGLDLASVVRPPRRRR
jgi:hypothetical protein